MALTCVVMFSNSVTGDGFDMGRGMMDNLSAKAPAH